MLHDFQADGVVYLELRTTPRAMPATGVTKETYVRTVSNILTAHNTAETSMRTFLLLSIDRRNTVSEAEEVVDLAIQFQSSGVVGLDLCGDPAKGDVRIFAPAFARARAAGLKLTLHFAEADASASDAELQTLLSWKPHRLGHVIHVKEAFRRIIENDNIGVELCLSCNVHAKMITGTYGDHHFGTWRLTKVPVALSVNTPLLPAAAGVTDDNRPMMLACSAVPYPMSTTSPLSTLALTAKPSERCAQEPLTPSFLAQMNTCVSRTSMLTGKAGQKITTLEPRAMYLNIESHYYTKNTFTVGTSCRYIMVLYQRSSIYTTTNLASPINNACITTLSITVTTATPTFLSSSLHVH